MILDFLLLCLFLFTCIIVLLALCSPLHNTGKAIPRTLLLHCTDFHRCLWILASPTEVADEFVRCQCTLCGHGGCSALVHPVRAVPFLSSLSLSEWILADIDAIAGPFCGECEQYHIKLHRQRIVELKLMQQHLEERQRKRDESATDREAASKKFKAS